MVNVIKRAQNVASDVGEAAEDVVEGAKETAEEVVEQAKDAKEEVEEGDVKGAVEEATETAGKVVDTAQETAENVASGEKDTGKKQGKPSEIGKSRGDRGGDVESGGKDDLEAVQRSFQRDPGEPELPDTQKKVDQAQEFRQKNPALAAANPQQEEALKAREQNLQARENVDELIQEIRGAPQQAEIVFGEGEQAETLQKQEAIQRLESKKKEISQTLEKNEERFLRSQKKNRTGPNGKNIIPSEESVQDVENLVETDGRTTKSVEEVAKKTDLDNLKVQGSIPIVGDGSIGFTVGGLGAKTLASFDTFTSGRGFEQLSTIITDKRGSQLIKEQVVESRREEFDVVNEAKEVAGSPGGVALTSLAAGGAFITGTKALAARGGTSAAIGKTAETAAAVGGTLYAGKELAETEEKLSEGKETEAVANTLRLGTEFAGFAKGARSAGRYLSPEVTRLPGGGPRSVRGKTRNFLRQTGEKQFSGTGQFQGRFKVEAPTISEKLGIAQSGVGRVQARYRTQAVEGGAESQGLIKVETPGGKVSETPFTAVNRLTGRSETLSGQKVARTRDIIRTRTEGRFFTSKNTRSGRTKTIRESDQFTEIPVRDAPGLTEQGRIIRSGSRSADDSGNIWTVSDTTTVISNPRGRGGSAGSGTGSTASTSGGGTTVQAATQARTSFREGRFDFSTQIGRGVQDGISIRTGIGEVSGGAGLPGRKAQTQGSNQQQVQTERKRSENSQDLEIVGPDQEFGVEEAEQQIRVSRTSTQEKVQKTRNQGGTIQKTKDRNTIVNPQTNTNVQTPDTQTRLRAGQQLRQNVRQETKQRLNQPQRFQQVQTPGQTTFQGTTQRISPGTVQRLEPRTTQRLERLQRPITSTPVTTTTTSPPGKITGFNLDISNTRRSTTGNENIEVGGNRRRQIETSILSANRAELLTGSKTFDITSRELTEFNQSPFSGGVKTEEEKKLKTRKFNSDKEVEFF